jgi:hypothetical protein
VGGQDTATGVLRAKLRGVLQLIYRHFPTRVRNPLQGGQYSEIKQLVGFEAVRPLHIYIWSLSQLAPSFYTVIFQYFMSQLFSPMYILSPCK